MRKIHFYKTKSRLGIVNPPIYQKDLNLGVEDAPDAILTKEFLSKFDSNTSEFIFSKPEKIKDQYFDVLATSIPSTKGFMFYELLPLIEIVSKHPNLSLDLSEVNPQKKGGEEAVKIAQKVLQLYFYEQFERQNNQL